MMMNNPDRSFPIIGNEIDEAPTLATGGVPPGTTDVTICPNCGRKLLTQASALCNWCGARINDEEYQRRAAEARHEMDVAERIAVETAVAEDARMGAFGRMKRRAANPKSIRNELKP
jgi:hypothetical protein